MRILTFDQGTGSLKACLWSDGVQKAKVSIPITTRFGHQTAEQDANEWWEALIDSVHMLSESNPDIRRTDLITLTGHMHAVVPVASDGSPTGPVPIVSDRRARLATGDLGREFGKERILQWTGGRLDPSSVLAKCRHFQQEGSESWKAARWLLPPKDFLRLKLTNVACTDPIDAAGTMFWDISSRDWHPELLAFCGLNLEKFPPVHPTVSVAGRLSSEAAGILGLPEGIPVSTGGGDDIEAFGSGALLIGDLYEHLGTTGSMCVMTAHPIFDPHCEVETYPDVVEGRWITGGSTNAAGLALEWARRGLQLEDEKLFAKMTGSAHPPRAIFLPYLSGERSPIWEPDRRGAFLGLTMQDGPEELAAACLQGVVFSLQNILDRLTRLGATSDQSKVFTSGPLGASETFGQVRADTYRREVVRHGVTSDTTSWAAMILGQCSVTQEDPYAVAQANLAQTWSVQPRMDTISNYEAGYRRYLRASSLLNQFDVELDEESKR